MEQNKNNHISNISKILSSNGEDRNAWSELLCNVISEGSKVAQETVFSLKQNLINKEKVDLTLDIIDYLIIYGSQEIIENFAQKDFLNAVFSLLKNKSKSSVQTQKKIIFLVQKWNQKFENDKNPKVKGFNEIYNSLKKNGITFPPSNYFIQTYNNYISEEESQNSQMKANAIKKLEKETEEIRKSMDFENPFEETENSNNKYNNNIIPDDDTFVASFNPNKNINDNNNLNNNNNMNNNKKNEDIDEENPYLQKDDNDNNKNEFCLFNNNNDEINKNKIENNKIENNQIENNKKNVNNVNNINNQIYENINNKYNKSNIENNLPNFSEQNNQESKLPNYPSQMGNLVNNNNLKSNPNLVRNKTNNYPDNPFAQINYNINNNINNNNNKNDNKNFNKMNSQNINNKYNDIKKNQYNNINNNNYNINNKNQYSQPNDYALEAKYYKRLLGNRLLQLNAWINNGKFSFSSGQLKQGIKEILNEITNCNNMMRKFQNLGDRKAYETIRNMRSDIEQTCARYEALMNDKQVEPFFSSFSGNSRQYYFNANNMFGIQEQNNFGNNNNNFGNNNNMGNFDNYYKSSGLSHPINYGYNYESNENNVKEKSFGDKLSDFGNDVKDGFVKFGHAVKDKAVSGYNFVKKKFSDD